VTVATDKNFTQTGAGTFSTGTGNISLNGSIVTNISQTGVTAFSTGTGAVSLNGDTTIAGGKGLTAAAGAGNINFSASTGTFQTSSGAVSLNGNTTVTGTKTLNVAGGLTTLGAGLTVSSGNTTLTNGNLTLGTAGNKINITAGTNATVGTAQSGSNVSTLVVNTTAVTASSLVFVTGDSTLSGNCSTVSGAYELRVSARTAGTSFTVTSAVGSGAGKFLCFQWWIIN
jgi:hypothetical protein